MECLKNWSQLCTVEDMKRILDMSMNNNETVVNEIVMKCMAHFSLNDLKIILSRLFYQKGFSQSFETADFKENFKLKLNQIQMGESDFVRDLLLLFLQNSTFVLTELYMECLQCGAFTQCLAKVNVIKYKNNTSNTFLF